MLNCIFCVIHNNVVTRKIPKLKNNAGQLIAALQKYKIQPAPIEEFHWLRSLVARGVVFPSEYITSEIQEVRCLHFDGAYGR